MNRMHGRQNFRGAGRRRTRGGGRDGRIRRELGGIAVRIDRDRAYSRDIRRKRESNVEIRIARTGGGDFGLSEKNLSFTKTRAVRGLGRKKLQGEILRSRAAEPA